MTEQEIINVLKENKTKGVAYMFLPEAVRDWVSEHFSEPKLLHLNPLGILYLNPMGNFEEFDVCSVDDYDNIVFALSDDYKIKQEPKGEWVEFEINQRGQFLVIFTQNLRYYFNWFEWWRLLEKSIGYNYGFTAFGGWQYEDSKRWYLAPAVKLKDGDLWNSYVIEKSGEATPVIPVKIRFWREHE